MKNNADESRFEIQEGRTNRQTKLVGVDAQTGDMAVRGDLVVGGEASGDRRIHVTAHQGESALEVVSRTDGASGFARDASVQVRAEGEQASGDASVSCLLYTSDAADEEDSVDLGGRRIIKKKKSDE
eukprot:TRINITY_DN63964_c0_g2_i2.p1 TRINITY_DN63964_c0_g2~~TRINITY_DN63964_c0_g2_i2.p1  ORF type:complete len:127 (-),score=40.04 TRINITY_DN63964_c0_g2_i2:74-454(-)